MSVMDVTGAVLAMVPSLPDGSPSYLNREPGEADMPPWLIASCTTANHMAAETMRFAAHAGRLELRAVGLTDDAVNAWCDDLLIPTLHCHAPEPPAGFTVGQLVLQEDSGSYPAGLTADDTARRYRVRVLRFRFTWSRP